MAAGIRAVIRRADDIGNNNNTQRRQTSDQSSEEQQSSVGHMADHRYLYGSSEGEQLAQDPDRYTKAAVTKTFCGGVTALPLGVIVSFPMPNQEVIAGLLIALQKLVAPCNGLRFFGLRPHS